jgi:hypothetical protein
MRYAVLALLAGCGGGQIADAPAKPAAPTCKSAAEHMIDELVAGKEPRPPDDAINAQIALVRDHCEKDGWSEPARACFIRMKSIEDADQCGTYLTTEQQAALGPPPPPTPAE